MASETTVNQQFESKNEAELFHQLRSTSNLKVNILGLVSLPKESKVLDLGCGTGEITYQLAEMASSKGRVIGVDPDKDRLKIAIRNNKFPNLSFVEGDSATFPEDQYDLIFCNYVTDFIEDKETLYKRVHDNLKPGGQFVLIAKLRQATLVLELIELMGSTEKKAIDDMFFFCPVNKFDELAEKSGFTMTLKQQDINVATKIDPEDVISSWKAVSHGVYLIQKSEQRRFRQVQAKI